MLMVMIGGRNPQSRIIKLTFSSSSAIKILNQQITNVDDRSSSQDLSELWGSNNGSDESEIEKDVLSAFFDRELRANSSFTYVKCAYSIYFSFMMAYDSTQWNLTRSH